MRLEAAVHAEIFTGDAVLPATTRNLSPGGVALVCDRALPQGATLGLNLFVVLDGIEDALTPALLLRGKVAWCREEKGVFTAGVKFDEVGGAAKTAVERLLRTLSPA
ncbi:MAG: PilZ domain-containing protein [Myxococcota bacterium]